VERELAVSSDADADTTFQATPDLVDAVNAAIYLRRPLLVTGPPGSGKSSLIRSVARELKLGPVLRWHITSSSTLKDALYRYDALGRMQEHQFRGEVPPVSAYLRLGPLGTALLPSTRPRALLVDEIDKSDVDLPNDLLDVFERGQFEIPELARLSESRVEVPVHHEEEEREGVPADRGKASREVVAPVDQGVIKCREFPFVVLTSNGERDFPGPFLRRCVQFEMAQPTPTLLTRIVAAHLGSNVTAEMASIIEAFAEDVASGRPKAIDQLLNTIFLLTQPVRPSPDDVQAIKDLLLRDLETDPL
jgi:MoxR-like ATPase